MAESSPPGSSRPPQPHSGSGLRTALTILAAALTTLLLLLASITYWVKTTLLDSDEFSSQVSSVLARPEAADRIGDVLATRILASGRLQDRIVEALPENAGFLPVLFEQQLHDALSRTLARLAGLDATRALEDTAILNLHRLLISTLRDERDRLGVAEGSLVLDLNETVSDFLGRVDDRLGTDFATEAEQEETGTIVLISDTKALDQAAFAVRAIDTATPALAILSLIGLLTIVVLAGGKAGGFATAGAVIMGAALLSLLLWRIAGVLLSTYLEETPVARMILDALSTNLRTQSIVLLVAGGLVVVAAQPSVWAWLAARASGTTAMVQSFGFARSVLVGATGVAVAILVS